MPDGRRDLAQLEDLPPVVAPGTTPAGLTDQIAHITLKHPRKLVWMALFAVASLLLMMFVSGVAWLLLNGVGIWGVNMPVAWGIAIGSFVWWIGIGHAGTLISAILLLLHQEWRNSINRFAEAMTLFAVMCAGMYPLLHLGRPWLFYWLIPYPNNMSMWPQFRSPLVWDVFAVSTYFTVSLIFWYAALIPDFGTMRDKATNRAHAIVYGFLALGWRGSARHWQRFQVSYLLLGGLATPLVLSVHTVVSFDFAVAIVPGWHSTIFPPYFVAGAIFSGFAMVMMLAIPIRAHLGPREPGHGAPSGEHGEGDSRHGADRRRTPTASSSSWRGTAPTATRRLSRTTAWPGLTHPVYWGDDAVERALHSGALVQERAAQPAGAVCDLASGADRNVAGALHDRREQPAPRLPAALLGYVLRHGFRLDDIRRHVGIVPFFFLLFLRYVPMITMFEMREMAHKAEARGPGGGHAREPFYGMMAEFEEPEEFLAAVRRDARRRLPADGCLLAEPARRPHRGDGTARLLCRAIVLIGGLAGAISGFFLQYYAAAASTTPSTSEAGRC